MKYDLKVQSSKATRKKVHLGVQPCDVFSTLSINKYMRAFLSTVLSKKGTSAPNYGFTMVKGSINSVRYSTVEVS